MAWIHSHRVVEIVTNFSQDKDFGHFWFTQNLQQHFIFLALYEKVKTRAELPKKLQEKRKTFVLAYLMYLFWGRAKLSKLARKIHNIFYEEMNRERNVLEKKVKELRKDYWKFRFPYLEIELNGAIEQLEKVQEKFITSFMKK